MIPETIFQKIKEEADIVKIISEYIKLEKKSSSYIGLCPFHPDQNPSLNVSPTKKIYKCFSCGAAGDVINFIKDYEKVPFARAVQIAGEKSGIEVNLVNDENIQSFSKYYNILSAATNFYHFLLENTVSGEAAKKYLYKRNLNDEIIKRFKIGLASDEPDLLYKSLLEEKHQPLDMVESGVIRGTTSYIDVFRNRIMFPLDDIDGRIVGFSGRVYTKVDKEIPKYINSSENKVFKKGNILYNFSNAQNYIRQEDLVFVFEGFMDVIAAYKAGIYNAVATMGTSISQNHLKTLKKTTNNIVICYDGDLPGIEASKKAIVQFLKFDFNVSSILLPEGSDPDDYINKNGVDKLRDLLVNSQISGYDYLYETAKKSLNQNDLNSIELFKNEIFNLLGYFNSSVLTEKFLMRLSDDLNVSLESIRSDFNKIPAAKPVNEYYDFPGYVEYFDQPEEKVKHRKDKYDKASKILIKIAHSSKELCDYIKVKLDDHHINRVHNSLLAQIITYYSLNDSISDSFNESLGREEQELLLDILTRENELGFIEMKKESINEYVNLVKLFSVEKEVDALLKEINEVEMSNEEKLEKIKIYTSKKKELTNLRKINNKK